MPNILAQMPKSLLETVNIKREDAFGGDDIEVASGIQCYINPDQDLISVEGGVAQRWLTYKLHLGEPLSDVFEGDQIERTDDDTGYKVYRILDYGSERMSMIIRSQGIL